MSLCLKNTLLYSFDVFICLTLVQVLCEPVRNRRQTTQGYVIDVGVVVDDVMFARWIQWIKDNTNETVQSRIESLAEAKVKEYVSLTFHQANVRMSSLKPLLGYDVSLQVVNVTTNQKILGESNTIDAIVALEAFKNWTTIQGLSSQYDHVMLMTSKSIHSGDYESSDLTLQGRAYVARMCSKQGYSSSIVEDRGGFMSSYHLTHEVAHSLGAEHDGESTASSCPASDHYIMSAVGMPTSPETADRPWYFSNCSATDIKNNIQNILAPPVSDQTKINCLQNNGVPIAEFTATKSVVPGQQYPPTKQCQMIYGKSSRVCPDQISLNICTSMSCLLTGETNKCARYFAAEGTSCGNKKWCAKGQCVGSDAAPEIGDCYLGDSITTNIATPVGNQNCSSAITSFPLLCYNVNVSVACCASCKTIEQKDPACKYGDMANGCIANDCSRYDEKTLTKCCWTCSKSPQNINNEPTVLSFTANGSPTAITVNSTTAVTLRCVVQSDAVPAKALVTAGKGLGRIKEWVSPNEALELTLSSLTCEDSGRFFCSGLNGFEKNNSLDWRYVDVNIVCELKPKDPTVLTTPQIIQVSPTKDTVFTLEIYGFPVPTNFSLKVETGRGKEAVDQGRYSITYIPLTPPVGLLNVTIYDAKTHGTTTYFVNIKNEVGSEVELTLQVKKEDPVISPRPDEEFNKNVAIGVGVGVACGVVVIVVVIVVGVYLVRRNQAIKRETRFRNAAAVPNIPNHYDNERVYDRIDEHPIELANPYFNK